MKISTKLSFKKMNKFKGQLFEIKNLHPLE